MRREHIEGPADFLDVHLSPTSIDRWLPRTRILEAVRGELPHMHGVVLDLGCGVQPYRSLYLAPPSRAVRCIGVDMPTDRYGGHDVGWDGTRLPIGSASVDHVVATEVLEHCPDPGLVVAEAFRVLQPGGRFFFTVPFLWPLHDAPYDEYRYTPFALERILAAAGFTDITIAAMGGWDASLAQMLALWVRRRPMGPRRRKVLSALAVPVVRRLVRNDRLPRSWGSGVMVTALSGSAVKPNVASGDSGVS